MISKTINCNVHVETLALILLWGFVGVLVKMQTEYFLSVESPNDTYVQHIFHCPAESYGVCRKVATSRKSGFE